MSLNRIALVLVFAFTTSASRPTEASIILNGDFEAGNNSFTSGYVYTAGFNTTEGQYTVRTDPQNWNGVFFAMPDHTLGGPLQRGNMLVVNGATSGSPSVWQQLVNVTASTDYDFSMWVSTAVAGGPASLVVSINGVDLGTPFSAPNNPGRWIQLLASWNSGASTTADIKIVNGNLSVFPNDFYVDDISFASQGAAAVPEPSSLAIFAFGAGCVSVGQLRRRRLKAVDDLARNSTATQR